MVDIYVCCSMMHVLQRTSIPEKTLNIISVSFERLVVLCTSCVSIPKEIIEKVFPVTCHHKLSQQLNTASKNTFNFCILLYYYTNFAGQIGLRVIFSFFWYSFQQISAEFIFQKPQDKTEKNSIRTNLHIKAVSHSQI